MLPARLVVKHPAALSFEEAAAVWMQYVTAWGALVEQAKLGEGDLLVLERVRVVVAARPKYLKYVHISLS